MIGLVTGNDAAAKRDVLTHIVQRFPPANVLVAETYVQGPRAPISIATAIGDLCRRGADVIVLARGGGSFEDLLPFSDERVVRAVAECTVPIVSAVGHEQDTPLCDLAADVRASTPTAAARLVVPDIKELRAHLERTRDALHRGAHRASERHAQRLAAAHERLRRAPLLALERKRARLDTLHARLGALSPVATLERGYAIVRRAEDVVRSTAQVETGDALRFASPTGRSERRRSERAQLRGASKELEQIVERLERGDAGIDELTKLWERGEELYRICATKLEGVRGKIEELSRTAGES